MEISPETLSPAERISSVIAGLEQRLSNHSFAPLIPVEGGDLADALYEHMPKTDAERGRVLKNRFDINDGSYRSATIDIETDSALLRFDFSEPRYVKGGVAGVISKADEGYVVISNSVIEVYAFLNGRNSADNVSDHEFGYELAIEMLSLVPGLQEET